jgi:hypothetical protein
LSSSSCSRGSATPAGSEEYYHRSEYALTYGARSLGFEQGIARSIEEACTCPQGLTRPRLPELCTWACVR